MTHKITGAGLLRDGTARWEQAKYSEYARDDLFLKVLRGWAGAHDESRSESWWAFLVGNALGLFVGVPLGSIGTVLGVVWALS